MWFVECVILITGPTSKIYLRSLREVLQQLSDHSIKLNTEKCSFMEDKLVYMGHLVNKVCTHATHGKIQAIQNCP